MIEEFVHWFRNLCDNSSTHNNINSCVWTHARLKLPKWWPGKTPSVDTHTHSQCQIINFFLSNTITLWWNIILKHWQTNTVQKSGRGLVCIFSSDEWLIENLIKSCLGCETKCMSDRKGFGASRIGNAMGLLLWSVNHGLYLFTLKTPYKPIHTASHTTIRNINLDPMI